MAKPAPSAKVASPKPAPSAKVAELKALLADAEEALAGDEGDPVELVRVYNRGEGSFIHGEYVCSPKGFADVPKDVADLWASHSYNGGPAVVLASTMQAPVAGPSAAEVAKKDTLIAEQEEALKSLGSLLEQLRAAAPGASDEDLIARLKAGAPPAQ